MILEILSPTLMRSNRVKGTDLEELVLLAYNTSVLFRYLVRSTNNGIVDERILGRLCQTRSKFSARTFVQCCKWLIDRCKLPKSHKYIKDIENVLLELSSRQADYGWHLVRYCNEIINSEAVRNRIFELNDSTAIYEYAYNFGYSHLAAKKLAKCTDINAIATRLSFCAHIGANKELIDALRRDLDDLEAKLDTNNSLFE